MKANINILRIHKGQVVPWNHYLQDDIIGIETIERVALEVALVKETCLPFKINCIFESEEDAEIFCRQYSHKVIRNIKKKSVLKRPKKEAIEPFDNIIFV
ncbi:hypothetical protein [uncultured Gimesia sp.]|uniref:hypothetical protein n=1 Tax=uncultured Gimesia sp. TaxID=1678688 RepID=UPI0030DBDF8C|tara:strand:- start:20535 stop:20834 length:300 start_codon:yes stop_codon:yes gene_type:complete